MVKKATEKKSTSKPDGKTTLTKNADGTTTVQQGGEFAGKLPSARAKKVPVASSQASKPLVSSDNKDSGPLNLPPQVLRWHQATHSSHPPLLAKLALDPELSVKIAVASNERADESTLMELSWLYALEIKIAVAGNKNTNEVALHQLAVFAISQRTEALPILASVALNKRTSGETLALIFDHADLLVEGKGIATLALSNPNFDPQGLENLVCSNTVNFFGNKSQQIAIASNESTPSLTLNTLSTKSVNEDILLAVAGNKAAGSWNWKHLQESDYSGVREVAKHMLRHCDNLHRCDDHCTYMNNLILETKNSKPEAILKEIFWDKNHLTVPYHLI